MYFTDTPTLNRYEAIMKQLPVLRQRGGGRTRIPYQYTKKDCDCRLCEYWRKKKGCSVSVCPVLEIRVNCGAASFIEAVTAAFREAENPAFRRRLDQYIKKGRDFMIYENERHRRLFESEKQKLGKQDKKKTAVLYLLTADDALWRKSRAFLKNGRVEFSAARLGGASCDCYALWKAVKEIQSGEKQISLCELASKKDISDRSFRLIVQALTIARFGANTLKQTEERI